MITRINLISQKPGISSEIMSAIFIIAFVSLFILAGFVIGFNLPLFIVAMAIGAGIALAFPRSGLYAIIFLTFIFERFFTLQPIIMGRSEYKLYPLDIIFLAVIIGALFQILQGKIKLNFKKSEYFLIGFIILAAVYFLVSVYVLHNDFSLAFSSFKNYTFYALFYFAIILLIENKEQLYRFLKFALAGAVGIIFFVIFGFLNGTGLWSEFTPLSTEGVRTLAFPHAFYLSMALIFAIVHLTFQKVKHAQIWSFLIIIWTLGIIGSMMRHLWISIIFAVIATFFIIPKKYKVRLFGVSTRFLMVAIIAIVLMFYAANLFSASEFSNNVAEISNVLKSRAVSLADSADESIFWRNLVWKEVLSEYARSPILGLGLGDKIFVDSGSYQDFIELRNIHNSFFALLAQMGILAFGLLLTFVWILVREIWNKVYNDNNLNIIKFSVLGILVFHLIAFMFQPYLEANLLGIFFWINLGLLGVLCNVKRSTNIKS